MNWYTRCLMKVVVYLPVADERALLSEGLDPAGWVRGVVQRALSEREDSREGDGSSADSANSRSESVGAEPGGPGSADGGEQGRQPHESAPTTSFRPDFKKTKDRK